MRALVVAYLIDKGITFCVVDTYYAYGHKYCNHDYGNSYPSVQFTGSPAVLSVKSS
ncbi:MAG: hypothetical protein WAN47_02820 [Nitrosotalea sp.]